VIQSALYFALGFLAAVLLALLVVPPIWRRATLLTRRRIEAETPLTLNEIQAQRDGLRAEHAVALRKLEMTMESMKDKAASQLLDVSEKERLARTLSAELVMRDQSLAELQAVLASHQKDLEKVSGASAGQERLFEQRAAELELLHRRLASVATNADSLQIETAAQSARIDNLTDDLKQARQDKRDSDEQKRHMETELKALRHSMEQETKRSSELEKHSSALLRQLTDSEAMLARREKDVERTNERLRKVLADGRKQGSSVVDAPRGKEALVQAQESAVLREQMNKLASQVVAMVARLEGPGSPINELLTKGKDMPAIQDADGKVILSLADRVRGLQAAASEAGKPAETR
jgi:chromosome segregation ATPase